MGVGCQVGPIKKNKKNYYYYRSNNILISQFQIAQNEDREWLICFVVWKDIWLNKYKGKMTREHCLTNMPLNPLLSVLRFWSILLLRHLATLRLVGWTSKIRFYLPSCLKGALWNWVRCLWRQLWPFYCATWTNLALFLICHTVRSPVGSGIK